LAVQSLPQQSITLDRFKRLQHNGHKAELVNGQVRLSRVGLHHEALVVNVAVEIERFLAQHPLGHVYGSGAGYVLPNGNVRSPDVSFVSLRQLPGGESPVDYADFPPNLAVEILSPNDRVRDLNDKLAEYFGFGVRLVWVLDPKRQTATVYRAWTDAHTLRADETLDGGDVLPGFACRVSELFS